MKRQSMNALTLVAVLVFAGCTGTGEEELSSEIETAVAELGAPVAEALMGSLVSSLTGAMQKGGPAGAVEFCSTMASELTGEVENAQGLSIKRTSLQYRNPANAPDEDEIQALRHFEAVLAESGKLPGHWVQKASREEYRYYRPLSVAAPCLHCHGAESDIGPEVSAILAERYPDDLATGYEVGDFRGVIRVSVPAARLETPGG